MPETNENKTQRWTPEFLKKMGLVQDPIGDEVIESIMEDEGKERAKEIFKILTTHIQIPHEELPKAANDYFEAQSKWPDWADEEKIKLSEETFLDHGPQFMLFLFFKSLPTLYCVWRGAKVLTATGRLNAHGKETGVFSRRIGETAQFLLDVTQKGGVRPGGEGVYSALKIRLIHSSVRAFIPREHWDVTQLNAPISQQHLAITLMTFSTSMIQGLEKFGIKLEADKKEAMMHHWRVIGHFMGIQEELLPDNYAQGKILLDQILKDQAGPSEDGVLLTDALVEFAEKAMPSKLFDRAPNILIKFLIGQEHAEMLSVNPKKGCLAAALPAVLKLTWGLTEKLEDRSEPLEELLDHFSTVLLKGMILYFNKEKGQYMRIPKEMEQRYGVSSKRNVRG